MTTRTTLPAITYTATHTVPPSEVQDFVDLLCGNDDHCGDLLTRGFSGWWLYGVKCYKPSDKTATGWLVWDQLADETATGLPGRLELVHVQACLVDGRLGLPKGYYFVDADVAIQILRAGVAERGEAFYDGTCDYGDVDNVVQKVLLGSVVYG